MILWSLPRGEIPSGVLVFGMPNETTLTGFVGIAKHTKDVEVYGVETIHHAIKARLKPAKLNLVGEKTEMVLIIMNSRKNDSVKIR